MIETTKIRLNAERDHDFRRHNPTRRSFVPSPVSTVSPINIGAGLNFSKLNRIKKKSAPPKIKKSTPTHNLRRNFQFGPDIGEIILVHFKFLSAIARGFKTTPAFLFPSEISRGSPPFPTVDNFSD